MKKEACKAGLLVLAAAFAAVAVFPALGDGVAFARGESAAGRLDLREGTRLAIEGEAIPVAYSPRWGGAESCTIDLGGSRSVATEEGSTIWTPQGTGGHTLTHTAGDLTYTAQFAVLGDDVAVHGGALAAGETWGADKVHLVTAPLTVPSGVSLAIESGAVVKFMPGTSLAVESGGSCTARGAIFTHVNDDTAGGDTLMDGDETAPKTGDYTVTGGIIDDDATEYRYLPPQTLTSSISSDTRLRGYRTYIVSNSVTVASGATLTLQPGTILKFNTGCSLTVNGTLDAQGTRAAPIVFTSLKDDAHGGDTNGDGEKTYAQAGDWYQIRVSGTANFDYCHVLYNSSSENYGGIEAYGGTVNFDNSEIAHTKYECVNANNSGYFTARNSIFRDSSLGFGYYGSGRVKAYNCVFADLTSGIRQSGKTLANCVFYRCLAFTDQSGDGSTFKNCVFFNPSGYGAQSYSKCGSNGNVWGDPLFADADNGDFSIAANSPCVDAGDASVAPEFDYYGKPRVGAPDIGIYEVAGANATGYDLAATAVAATTARFVVGDTIEASCTVANVGRLAVADQWHDALYLVSSSSGKMYLLGEQLNPGGIGAGESRTFSLRFALPVVPAGMYRLRLVANSRRMDVPEGAATENNVVVSEGEIEVAEEAVDAAKGASGSVAAGASAVCAFTMPSGSGDRLMRIVSIAGGAALSARGGLDFLPVDAASGMSLSFSGGTAWLSIPAGTEKVWLVLDNGGATAADYEVGFIDGSLTISGVSPSSIPSSGNITVEIAGAGFSDGCEVTFTGAGTVAPLSMKRVSQGLLAATVDAAAFAPGKTYSVAVKKSAETKTLADAMSVAAAPGKAEFWAKLDVPNSMRQGRLMETCFIEYGNSGTADMPSPVLQVSMTGDGTLGYIGGLSGLKTLQFVAAGDAGSAGVLRPGSSHRIRFAIRAGASNRIALHTSEGSDYAPAPWTNAADYLADLSKAATRVGLRGQDATDYVGVFDLAKAVRNGEPSSAICGRVVDENGEGVCNLLIDFTNAIECVSCLTDVNGNFCGKTVSGTYGMAIHGVSTFSEKVIQLNNDTDYFLGNTYVMMGGTVIVHLVNADKKRASLLAETSNGENRLPSLWNSDTEAVFSGLPDGTVRIKAKDGEGTRKSQITCIYGGCSQEISFDFSADGVGEIDFAALGIPVPKGFMLYDGSALERVVVMHDDITYRVEGLAPGDYMLFPFSETAVSDTPVIVHVTQNPDLTKNKNQRLLSAGNSETSAETLRIRYNTSFIDFDVVDDAKKYARELLSRQFPAPADQFDCDHNWDIYARQSSRREEFNKEFSRFLMLEELYDKSLETKWEIIKENTVGLTVDSVGVFVNSLKKAPIFIKLSVSSCIRLYSIWESLNDRHLEWNEKISLFLSSAAQDAETADLLRGVGESGLAMFLGAIETAWSFAQHLGGLAGGVAAMPSIDEHAVYNRFMDEMEKYEETFLWTYKLCCPKGNEQLIGNPVDTETPSVPKSWDPNEMAGPEGIGEARYVRPGQELTYTIYFENKEGFDIADAQEVRVTNPLCEWLDWSTFRMLEVAFNNQCDVTLDGLANGTSEVQMTGTNKYVRTTVECDVDSGVATWYMRVYDPNGDSEGYPLDGSGFLQSNDETHRGEGHITYRVKVREDAPAGVVVTNSASIVFDYNAPIETDPAWWNTVAEVAAMSVEGAGGDGDGLSLIVGQPYGELPDPGTKDGYTFAGWYTGPNGTGKKVTASTVVASGDNAIYAHWKKNSTPTPTPTPAPTPEPEPEPEPEPAAAAMTLFDAVEGVVATNAASVYDGFLRDADGAIAGTVQVKVSKPDRRTGLSTVTATVQPAGGKKKTLKAAAKGKAALAADGPTAVSFSGDETCEIVLGADSMSGAYGEYSLEGARNAFASKSKEEKAAAEVSLAPWLGAVNVKFDGGTASVAIQKTGKARATVTLVSGAKETVVAQVLAGDGVYCIPVVAQKKAKKSFALWLQTDGTVAVEGLGDGAVAAKAVVPPAELVFAIFGGAEAWTAAGLPGEAALLPDGFAFSGGAKWKFPKADTVKLVDGVPSVTKANGNPSGLKLTYKASDGTFKGTFKAYCAEKGRLRSKTVNISGIMVGEDGFGAAEIKKTGSIEITISRPQQ